MQNVTYNISVTIEVAWQTSWPIQTESTLCDDLESATGAAIANAIGNLPITANHQGYNVHGTINGHSGIRAEIE